MTDNGLKTGVTIAGFISAKTLVYFRMTKENFKSNLVLRYEFILASSNDLMSVGITQYSHILNEGQVSHIHILKEGKV